MKVWLLTVWLVYSEVDQIWLERTFKTETECRKWQAFYNEYPFKPQCKETDKFLKH